jgi:hypothetical protein
MEGQTRMDDDVELINKFCERHDLVWAIDTATVEAIIVGEHDARIYAYDIANGKLAVAFVPDDHPDGWGEITGKMLKARFRIIRDCICDSYASFDPMSEGQSLLALSIAGIKPAKNSARKRAKMCEIIAAARQRKGRATELKNKATMRELKVAGVYFDNEDARDAAGYLTGSSDWMHGRLASTD